MTFDTENTTDINTAAEAATIAVAAGTALTKMKFHFKTEKMRDETGKEIGQGKKHPSVELDLPVPSISKLQEFLSNPTLYVKEVDLLMNAITDQVYRIARTQINDFRETNKDATVTAAVLNYDKLDWSAIASMPKSERGSSIPSEEDIKAFLEVYLELMPTALNKSKDKIENHVVCFQTGFKKQKAQKEILEMFTNALSVFITSAGESVVEDHLEVIEYFSNRLEKMLKSEEKITMSDL